MNFAKHYLTDAHAFLGASKYQWIDYDTDKLLASYNSYMAAKRGTELHKFAADCIRLKRMQPDDGETLNMFVNDGIGFGMTPEQTLFYSHNCFGTADAISFYNNELRIHDLKTGVIPGHMEQLEIYAALFCLEYGYNPNDIFIELRLYQNNEIIYHNPGLDDIVPIMDKIVEFDKILNRIRE